MIIDRLWNRDFFGLFFSQFFGALNDNFFRCALITLWAISSQNLPLPIEILAMLTNLSFVLPFVLLPKISGVLADTRNRASLIRNIKLFECVIMLLATLLFLVEGGAWVNYAMLVVVFLMGVQSALFGPVKYAILPQIIRPNSLTRANAVIESSTFVAILSGMLIGAFLIEQQRVHVLVLLLLVVALGGLCSALLISTSSTPCERTSKSRPGFFAHFLNFFHNPRRASIVLAISWFWAIGAILVTQLPVIAQQVGQVPGLVTFFLAILIVGIGLGNALSAYLSTRYSTQGLLSLGVIAYLVMGLLLWDFATLLGSLQHGKVHHVSEFLHSFFGAHFSITLLVLAIAAGMFSVPLYTALLQLGHNAGRGRNIALNNFCNAIFMALSALLVIVLLLLTDLAGVFLVFSVLHLLVLPAVVLSSDEGVARRLLRGMFRLLYRVRVRGLEHYPMDAHGLLIACNHVSYLDAPLLLAFLPGKPVFVIDKETMKFWWVRMWLGACTVYPLDSQSPFAIRTIIKILNSGAHVVVFPEGAISDTGRLGKVYAGLGTVANRTGKPIFGARIAGLELTRFARMQTRPNRLFARVSLNLVRVETLIVPRELSGRQKRKFILDETARMMSDIMFQTSDYRKNLYQQLLDTARDHGLGRAVVEDIQNAPMSYRKLLVGSQVLGKKCANFSSDGGGIGVLLPNSQAAVTTFFALQAMDRVPVMLNFTAGIANLISAVQVSTIQEVITSRRFVELAGLEKLIDELNTHVKIVYLEDLRNEITPFDKIFGLLKVQLGWIPRPRASSESTAVILFSSGSEGAPKGVALSHGNLLANIYQVLAAVDFSPADRLFNPLPMFHCFGLTAGCLLPILSGGVCYQFPTPLRYRQVVELIYHWKATVLFGANSFLYRYAEVAVPQDLQSLRYVFAGAEKLKDETYQLWIDKFGIQILQGYGVSETSPVLSVNTRGFHKVGSVGLPLSGIECRLKPVPDFVDPQVGVLQVRGPNVMQGYCLAETPGTIIPPEDDWYDTGDIVHIDEEHYLTILGRQRRFAKIAGEMVSLGAVENLIGVLWPGHQHAVVYRDHPRRGEEIVLYSENPTADREQIRALLQREGQSPLLLPGEIVILHELPLLGTGKVDYVQLEHLATQTV